MQFSRKNIIIVSGIAVVCISLSIWLFFFSDKNTPTIITPSPEEAPVVETPDDIRTRQINLIQKSIKNARQRTGFVLPEPSSPTYFTFGDIPLGTQGFIPDSLYEDIGLTNLRDPLTNQSYLYALSPDGRDFEILAFLDQKSLSEYFFGETPVYRAGSKQNLFLTDEQGALLITREKPSSRIDLSMMETRKALSLNPLKSCKEIYDVKGTQLKPKSGIYTIDIDGIATKVFCDMQTDGGGWTLFYANNGYEDSKIQMSYVEMRDALKENIFDISNYDDQYLAGLLPFRHFTGLGAKEILIRNRTGEPGKWVKFTFGTSRTLDWALGPAVLGKTDYGCIDLPRRATWSIANNDKKIVYENLTQMMNHTGTSWGVSHEKYLCNQYSEEKNPHIAFYNADSAKYFDRNRSNDGIGGDWGEGGGYRYFIR